MRKLFWTFLLLVACAPGPLQVELSPKRALVGEEVTATLTPGPPGKTSSGVLTLPLGVHPPFMVR